jgi:pterin-4a-carbinolamine dehydratase
LEVAAMSPWPAPEREIWRPRPGILQPSDLRRALREHPAWQLHGQRLIRELRFTDFAEAFGFVEQLASQVKDFGRHPDICLHHDNHVRIAVANPHHVGVTVTELRLLEKVDTVIERYQPARQAPVTPPAPARAGVATDTHEHLLAA